MDKSTFDKLKVDFQNLTGKDANENLEAYFSYLNLLSTMNINDNLKAIRSDLPRTDSTGKILL